MNNEEEIYKLLIEALQRDIVIDFEKMMLEGERRFINPEPRKEVVSYVPGVRRTRFIGVKEDEHVRTYTIKQKSIAERSLGRLKKAHHKLSRITPGLYSMEVKVDA